MLPVLIYESDEATRARIYDGLEALKESGLPPVRIDVSTSTSDMMRRAIEAQQGICLTVFGIHDGEVKLCTELSNLVMQRNRYSYTLFCLHDPSDLSELLAGCMRPAGILIAPLDGKSLARNLTRIMEDYQSLIGDDSSDSHLTVVTNDTAYRISFDRILYLEALDKLLTIHMQKQSIAVRRSLSAIEKLLPHTFVRVHRAFVVNSKYIDQVNYSAMTLTLRNGDTLPVSRSKRNELKRIVSGQIGDLT